MNTDKLTTYLGAAVGILVAIGAVTQAQGQTLIQAGGVVVGLLVAAHGYFTNKPSTK
jgi:hypothetical protein